MGDWGLEDKFLRKNIPGRYEHWDKDSDEEGDEEDKGEEEEDTGGGVGGGSGQAGRARRRRSGAYRRAAVRSPCIGNVRTVASTTTVIELCVTQHGRPHVTL